MSVRSENNAKRRAPILRQIKYWREQGLMLKEIAPKIGRSFGSVKNFWNTYLAKLFDKEDFDDQEPEGVDCVTKIVDLAKKRAEQNQPYLFFVRKYGVRASTALKISEQLRN